MKKVVIALILMSLTVFPRPVFADGQEQEQETKTVIEKKTVCKTVYGEGEVCEVVEVEKTVAAGIEDNALVRLIVIAGVAGLLFSMLYKASYKVYLFDR